MRPKATQYTVEEGGDWRTFNDRISPRAVHSLRFSDGSEWDTVNGWRKNTTPIVPDRLRVFKALYDTLLINHGMSAETEVMKRAAEALQWMEFGATPLGPTETTPEPKEPHHSESASQTASTSSSLPEDILLAALKVLSELPISFSWSLHADSGRQNFSYEVSPPIAGAGMSPGQLMGSIPADSPAGIAVQQELDRQSASKT